MKINNIFDKIKYLTKIGSICISALGDDFAGLAIHPKGMALTIFPEYYLKYTGHIMELQKSLINPYTFEYLREQGIPGYVITMRSTDPDSLGQSRRLILSTKPTSHVLRTMFFPETIDNAGKAISTLSQIQRLMNLQYHPQLYNIIMQIKDVFYFKLCTEDTWYVPLYNIEAWVKAGKPADGSSFHVKITSVMSLVAVADSEAKFLDQSLVGSLDISWTKSVNPDYDPIGELPKMRVVRLLEAIRMNNQKEIKKIIAEVKQLPGDFIANYNKIDDSEAEVQEEEMAVEFEQRRLSYCSIQFDHDSD